MRHVDHEIGADLVRDLAEALEVPDRASRPSRRRRSASACARAARLRAPRPCRCAGRRAARRRAPTLNHLPDMLTGEPWVRWPPAARSRPMNVSPGCISARNTAWLAWRAGVRLHVGEAAAEQLLRALDGEVLGDVDELAAAVVALAGIAFGVLVGQHRALRLQHGAGDDVLGGDQLDLVALATILRGRWRGRSRDRCRRGPRGRKYPPSRQRLGRGHLNSLRFLIWRAHRRAVRWHTTRPSLAPSMGRSG